MREILRKKEFYAILLVALVSVVVFVVVAVNHNRAGNETTYPVTVEASDYPLNLSMTINKTVFRLGEPVKIRLRIKNIGNKTLVLSFGDRDRPSFIVYNEEGSEVYRFLRHVLYPTMYNPVKISPGDEFSFGNYTVWYQKVEPYQNYHLNDAPPGTYHIIGEFVSTSLDLTIQTPPITIKIVG